MPVQTSVVHIQQDGRHSRGGASRHKETASSNGDYMSSLGTDDLESVAWGIDVKPRSVSRLSGTTTIEVEPAPEEVDWINPLFRPFDDND